MSDALYEVGETLICGESVERRDGRSSIRAGDKVKVLQEFRFDYQGKKCQDITVQRSHDLPIAVLVEPGRFKRPPQNTTP